jgi:simple sugar transport system ATP-binding protein
VTGESVTAAESEKAIIQLDGISMWFGMTQVLEDVNFSVAPGEVVGLVGDNGAGKSTLLKIITGYHQPTRGTLRFRGEARRFESPGQARELGIETVYQDLALVDEMALWRNFFLGKELVRRVGPLHILRRSEMRQQCETSLTEIGLTRFRSPDAPTAVLSGGERQSLAIMRAIHFGAVLLLLDEPTAALSVKETNKVFAAIEMARTRRLGVVYIDHNMAHVYPIADRIVALRHGRVLAEVPRGTKTLEEVTGLLM